MKCLSCHQDSSKCVLCRDPRKQAPDCESDNSGPTPCSLDTSRDATTCECKPRYYESSN